MYTRTEGKKIPGVPMLRALSILMARGHVMLMIIGADLPAPSANPQDSKRAVVAYFGTYSVDDVAKTVTYTAERATAPNFDGLARKASVTLNGDELVQVSAPVTGPKGTFNPNIVWKRSK
jgi:Lipocalin-like domain